MQQVLQYLLRTLGQIPNPKQNDDYSSNSIINIVIINDSSDHLALPETFYLSFVKFQVFTSNFDSLRYHFISYNTDLLYNQNLNLEDTRNGPAHEVYQ